MAEESREELADRPGEVHPKEPRPPLRSALTRWVAQKQTRTYVPAAGPSYERCKFRNCWGKATWECPDCKQGLCSAHRRDHSCWVVGRSDGGGASPSS